MFSRSEKTEDAVDPMAEEPSGERNPMMLAALAGLLAIAGAFMLVWYLSSGSDDVADGGADETSQQVLVVTQAIPRGTSVDELINAPMVYLSARAVPAAFVAEGAITSVAELSELSGLILSSEVLPGDQLQRARFRDPSNFDSSTQTFLETETAIDIPPGHHATVIELPSSRAMGGNFRAGEQVTVVGAFSIAPPEGDEFQVSLVVLNAIEVLNVESTLDVAGQISNDINQVGIANRGSYTITVAVTPEELTDLTYAMTNGSITLATAVEGLDNESGPRAVTALNQLLGDSGMWIVDSDGGNTIDFSELFTGGEAEGESIQLDLPTEEEAGEDAGDS